MITTEEIDERARQMSDDERNEYLTACGWTGSLAGWLPPSEPADSEYGEYIRLTPSGMYSRSTAIREQIAREDPDSVPGEDGRYYHGQEPADAYGRRW